jgi:glycosyl hydrolase family 113
VSFLREIPETIAALALVALFSCGAQEPPPSDPWTLYSNLARDRRVEIVAKEGDAQILGLSAARRLGRAGVFEVGWRTLAGSKEDFDSDGAARIWIGDTHTPGAARALERLGVRPVKESGFRFLDRVYRGENAVLVATLEDPDRAGLPLTLYLGVEAERAASLAHDLTPAWRPAFRVYAGGDLDAEGRLTPSGTVIPSSVVRFSEARRKRFESSTPVDCGPFDAIAPAGFQLELFGDWVAATASAFAEVHEWLGGKGSRALPDKPRIRLHASVEDKQRIGLGPGLGERNRLSRQLEVVLSPELPDDGGFALARMVALELRGEPAEAWLLDGVAAASVETWWRRPMDEWIAFLTAGELVPPLEELVDAESRWTPHLLVPLRGALCRALGREKVLGLWSGSRRLPLGAQDSTARVFQEWLAHNLELHREPLAGARQRHLAEVLARPFRNGIDLCEPQWGTANGAQGFGTRACQASLARAAGLGCDAVALVTRSWLEPPLAEFPWEGLPAERMDAASDLALYGAAQQAQHLGMSVMLQPHLLATRSGDSAALSLLNTHPNHERLFSGYRAFLVHYGLLAELCGAEILCIGTELPAATMTRPSEVNRRELEFLEVRRQGWESAIRAARASFTGALTYGARWDGEPGGIEFWPRLDFVGQNAFATLTGGQDGPSPVVAPDLAPRMRWNIEQIAKLATELGHPALITGIGFPSATGAWRDPSQALGGLDLEAQARFYQVLAAAMRRAQKERAPIAGLYVWSWCTDPDAGGGADRGFSPQNKPAESTLATLFARP